MTEVFESFTAHGAVSARTQRNKAFKEGVTKDMQNNHTVEKIGGTSMSRFGEVLNNVIIGHRKPEELYNRIFIVSAYGGITNLLLENKKNGEPGVFGKFAAGDESWKDALEAVRHAVDGKLETVLVLEDGGYVSEDDALLWEIGYRGYVVL